MTHVFNAHQVLEELKEAAKVNTTSNKRTTIPSLIKLKKAKMDEGLYDGVIADVTYEANVNTKKGIADRVKLIVDIVIAHPLDGSIRIEQIIETFYIVEGFNHRFKKRFEPLLGCDPHEGFATDELVGQVVEVEIKHNTDATGNVYDNFGQMNLKEEA